MRRLTCLPLLMLSLLTWSYLPNAAASGPTSTPTSASAPTSAPAPVDPAAIKILDRQEQAGDRYTTIEAKIVYNVDQALSGDTEERTGRIAYQKKVGKDPAKFYIGFDLLKQGEGKRFPEKLEYAFDGMWVTEAKHRITTITRWQVVAPGQEADPLRIGKGPFNVPFCQKTADVLKYFDVSTRPAKPTDPKNTDFIQLTTKAQYKDDINFLWMQMWVDRDTGLPAKLVSENKNEDTTTVTFSDTKTNAGVNAKLFVIEPPNGDWHYIVKPLEKGGSVK